MNKDGSPETPYEYLGAYGRVAYGLTDAKAHYTMEQRGAWLTAWCAAGRTPARDGRVKLKPLRAMIGQELLTFLIDEGDLTPIDDETLSFAHFAWCNEPMDAARRASKAYRDRQKGRDVTGDNVFVTAQSDDRHMTSDGASSSLSMSTSVEPEETISDSTPSPARAREADARGNPFEDGDPLDDFYLVTNQYPPEGGKLRPWIESVAQKGPSRRDFGVVFRDEWAKSFDVPTALRATEARLSKMGERVRKAEEAEERSRASRAVFETPFMRELREAIAENYDKPVEPTNGHVPGASVGALTRIGDLLPSTQRSVSASAGGSLTVDRLPDAQSAAGPLEANSFARGEEPGEPGPDRVEAPDGQGLEEGDLS